MATYSVPRKGYFLGVSAPGSYRELFNTDSSAYVGSGLSAGAGFQAQDIPWQNQPHSLVIDLPPLGTLVRGR